MTIKMDQEVRDLATKVLEAEFKPSANSGENRILMFCSCAMAPECLRSVTQTRNITTVLKICFWGRRLGSALKSIFCSPRGDLCLIPRTYMVAHNHSYLQFQVIGSPFLVSMGTRHVHVIHVHICRQNAHIHKIIFKRDLPLCLLRYHSFALITGSLIPFDFSIWCEFWV